MALTPATVQALRERLAQEEAAYATALARRVEIIGDLAAQDGIIAAHAAKIDAYRQDVPAPTPDPAPAPEPQPEPAAGDGNPEGDAS